MTLIESVILGFVEGITEFLPISSTGHLILTSSLLGLPDSEFLKSFEIVIQSGAIAAVLALYWRSFLDLNILKKITVAFLPTAIIGFTLYPLLKSHLLGSEQIVLWALLFGGAALILFELLHHESKDDTVHINSITYRQSAWIGLFQSVAVIPGVSRSGASIVGGLAIGLPRKVIVEFSFLLAVPTLVAATGYDLLRSAHAFSADQASALAVGFITSFIVALGSIVFLLRFVQHHTFIPFGIYRIVVAVIFWLFVFN